MESPAQLHRDRASSAETGTTSHVQCDADVERTVPAPPLSTVIVGGEPKGSKSIVASGLVTDEEQCNGMDGASTLGARDGWGRQSAHNIFDAIDEARDITLGR